MPLTFAFLRAVNVGGRTVKMDELRRVFESLDLTHVETFIASGNVIFEPGKTKNLKVRIEAALRTAFGFDIPVFLRADAELVAVANYKPFTPAQLAKAAALNIAFLDSAPTASAIEKLMALRNDIDDFHVHDREVYWLCRKKQSESKFSNASLEKALGQVSTMRGANTIQKLSAKYVLK